MQLNERIRKRRKELNLTAEDMAHKLGINRATYYRYESCDIEKIPLSVIEHLASALKMRPADLVGWTGETENASNTSDTELIGIKQLLKLTESRIKDKDELIATQKLVIEKLKKANEELTEERKMLKNITDTLIEAQGCADMASFYAEAEGFFENDGEEDEDED